ncbi:MAG: hypothetical protein JWM57_3507 [Phycisphaerales bacterium]|nr:hypothetical protein [Phycisphaerales bacterium]
MNITSRLGFVLILLFSGLQAARAETPAFPARPAMQKLEDGVQFAEVSLKVPGRGETIKVWIYLPQGTPAKGSLPVVFIAPAGSNLITGMGLADGDRQEHLPYVKAGFAVVSYELEGAMATRSVAEMRTSLPKFMAAHGGVDDAKLAIDYALAKCPEINPAKCYVAGHSSAATEALTVAAADKRIKACCAYAAIPNLRDRFEPALIDALEKRTKGFGAFIDSISPANHLADLKDKSILLFSADDDDNATPKAVHDFAAALQNAGAKKVKLITVPTGGHFDSMIKDGIPAGIAFLKQL